MASSMTNRHLAPEIYAASRRMKGKDTSTVVGDLQTKTYHDRHAQLNPHTVVGANLRQQEDANLFGRTAPVPGALSDMDDALPGARARPAPAAAAAPSVQWQAAADAQGRTYYYNSAGQTSWTPPPDMQVPQWTAQRDPASGRTYYNNAATGQTSWGQQPQQHYNSLASRFPNTFPG